MSLLLIQRDESDRTHLTKPKPGTCELYVCHHSVRSQKCTWDPGACSPWPFSLLVAEGKVIAAPVANLECQMRSKVLHC